MKVARVFVLIFGALLAGTVPSSAQLPPSIQAPLESFVTLERFRLYLTTKSLAPGQPFRADLYYWVGPNTLFSNPFQPNQPPKDGETQIVDVTFAQRPAPTFPDLAHARGQVLYIQVKSPAVWTIDHYVLIGKFSQTNVRMLMPGLPTAGAKPTPVHIDLGWRLMAVRDDNLVTVPGQTGGPDICNVYIPLNGTF